jgi:flavin-dependent dehydrogenase
MGDVVCLNDPITGQGSNNASKCAAAYLQRILERGTGPYEPEWMRETFETYWRYALHVTRWTNMMLRPPPEHLMRILQAGQTRPEVARWFVNAFDNPPALFPHIADGAAAQRFLDTVS